uniref:Uncharacterized protein n=1 Tax=Brassica oleracea TaxID=3712 RepID=A0A3P6H321_BRAOL|nr:unnamed protein product [Brassica oleracea]
MVSYDCLRGSFTLRSTLILSEWCRLISVKKSRYKGQDFSAPNEVRNAQKKIAEQILKISVRVATEAAESAASDGKTFCIIQLDVGLDAAAVREAVSKVVEKKEFKQLDVTEWLTTALGPLKGRCRKWKSCLASGQGMDASQVNAALDLAA